MGSVVKSQQRLEPPGGETGRVSPEPLHGFPSPPDLVEGAGPHLLARCVVLPGGRCLGGRHESAGRACPQPAELIAGGSKTLQADGDLLTGPTSEAFPEERFLSEEITGVPLFAREPVAQTIPRRRVQTVSTRSAHGVPFPVLVQLRLPTPPVVARLICLFRIVSRRS